MFLGRLQDSFPRVTRLDDVGQRTPGVSALGCKSLKPAKQVIFHIILLLDRMRAMGSYVGHHELCLAFLGEPSCKRQYQL